MINLMHLQNDEKWIAENVMPYKKEVDDFLEKASHPDKNQMLNIVKDAHNNHQIPKIINFCFINYKELPNCYYPTIHSWITNLSDYFFINWTPDILPECHWSLQMIRDKKWAFYADYARVYAVYNIGGFYIDCDSFIYKSFDDFLDLPYVFDLEYNSLVDPIFVNRIEAGIFGAQTHFMPLKYMVDFYQYIEDDVHNFGPLVAPFLWNSILDRTGYKVCYNYTMEKYREFIFKSEVLNQKILLTLNSTYLSRPNTKLINRCFVPARIGIREIEIEPHAYASHQMFSEWVPKDTE